MCSVRKTYVLSVTKNWSNCRRKLDVPVSSNFDSHRNPKIVVEQYPLVIKHSNGTSKNWWPFSCPSMVDVRYDWLPEDKSHEIPIKSLLNLMKSLFFRWCIWTPWTDLSRVAKACNMALILTTFPLSEAERGRCCKKDSALTNKIGRIVKNRIYLQQNVLTYQYMPLLVGGFKGVLSQENGTVMEIDSTFGRLKTSQTSPQRIPKTGNWSPKISTDRDIFSQTQPIVCVWSIARRWNMMEQAEWSAWECDWSENKICTLFSYRPTGLFGCNAKYSFKFYAAARPIPSQSKALQKPRPSYHPTDIDACSLGSLRGYSIRRSPRCHRYPAKPSIDKWW